MIADNYAKVFQTDCTTGNCAKVHHIFRRDDVSGTTDTVIDLLGLTKTTWIGKTGYFSPFCNGFSQTAAGAGLPPCDLRKDITSPSAAAVAAYDWDQQDWDPIRRRNAAKTRRSAAQQHPRHGSPDAADRLPGRRRRVPPRTSEGHHRVQERSQRSERVRHRVQRRLGRSRALPERWSSHRHPQVHRPVQ